MIVQNRWIQCKHFWNVLGIESFFIHRKGQFNCEFHAAKFKMLYTVVVTEVFIVKMPQKNALYFLLEMFLVLACWLLFLKMQDCIFCCMKRLGMMSGFGFTFQAGGSIPILFSSMGRWNDFKNATHCNRLKNAYSAVLKYCNTLCGPSCV